jgi:hypothetical protein
MANKTAPRFLTLEDLAKLTGLSKYLLRKEAKAGFLKLLRPSKRTVIADVLELDRWPKRRLRAEAEAKAKAAKKTDPGWKKAKSVVEFLRHYKQGTIKENLAMRAAWARLLGGLW